MVVEIHQTNMEDSKEIKEADFIPPNYRYVNQSLLGEREVCPFSNGQKPYMIMMVGLPCSGKSSYALKYVLDFSFSKIFFS